MYPSWSLCFRGVQSVIFFCNASPFWLFQILSIRYHIWAQFVYFTVYRVKYGLEILLEKPECSLQLSCLLSKCSVVENEYFCILPVFFNTSLQVFISALSPFGVFILCPYLFTTHILISSSNLLFLLFYVDSWLLNVNTSLCFGCLFDSLGWLMYLCKAIFCLGISFKELYQAIYILHCK